MRALTRIRVVSAAIAILLLAVPGWAQAFVGLPAGKQSASRKNLPMLIFFTFNPGSDEDDLDPPGGENPNSERPASGLASDNSLCLATQHRVVATSGEDAIDQLRERTRRTLGDKRVLSAARGMVFVQASFYAYEREARQLGAAPNSVVIATADGESLAAIHDATDAESLAAQITSARRKFTALTYDRKIAPTIRDETSNAKKLRAALNAVGKIKYAAADQDVIALLSRERLDATVKNCVFTTLASLSTRDAVEALFRAAESQPGAMYALQKCDRSAAIFLSGYLSGEQQSPEFARAYRAIAGMYRRAARADEFWRTAPQDVRDRELARIRKLIER